MIFAELNAVRYVRVVTTIEEVIAFFGAVRASQSLQPIDISFIDEFIPFDAKEIMQHHTHQH